MAQFIHDEYPSQATEIIQVIQCEGSDKSFLTLANIFRTTGNELNLLKQNGLTVSEKNYNVQFYFIGDFNVLHSILGIGGSNSAHICPWFLCQ